MSSKVSVVVVDPWLTKIEVVTGRADETATYEMRANPSYCWFRDSCRLTSFRRGGIAHSVELDHLFPVLLRVEDVRTGERMEVHVAFGLDHNDEVIVDANGRKLASGPWMPSFSGNPSAVKPDEQPAWDAASFIRPEGEKLRRAFDVIVEWKGQWSIPSNSDGWLGSLFCALAAPLEKTMSFQELMQKYETRS